MNNLSYNEIQEYIEENGCCPYCGGKRIKIYEIVELERERNAITGLIKKSSNRDLASQTLSAPVIYAQFICSKCGELTAMERIYE